MRSADQLAADYKQFRGRCKELSQQAVEQDPTLTLVRGHYFCPLWSRDEPHWWTVKADGTIHDPTKAQFPSNGNGIYTPFDGTLDCAECGQEVTEEKAVISGNYGFCCTRCAMKFVGLA